MDPSKIKILYKRRNTAINRLIASDYKIPKDNLSFEDFKILYNQNLHHLYYPDIKIRDENDDVKTGLLVYFQPNIKFDKKNFLSQLSAVKEVFDDPGQIFFALETTNSINKPKANIFVQTELEKHSNVQIWTDLYSFDISKNNLMPKFFKLSPEEKSEYLSISGKKDKHFPKLYDTDPLCLHCGAKIGEMIKIIRKNGDISYKIVIKEGTG